MSFRKLLPATVCVAVLVAMPMLFRRSVGALASSDGLARLGETVALLDSLRSEGWQGSSLRIVLRAGGPRGHLR